ncbi:hypothetical protein EXIGLDRAFT_717599 [Exidia glandulosa HHB12029]|uniref:Uncharacterized protein n=1 Tax=Exidia glandulosa HHB12029 TaxID=1314781 RepID=A0A165I8V3_EXIGL|nr:hypothetical protein EXIGLDRAFT_717599 [Exidia glandulosa HHB12029]
MVDTHTTTNTSSSPSALTAAQHALLDASLFQVRSLLTGTETRVDSANDTAGNNPDDDQLQTVAANANPARVSHPIGYDGAQKQCERAGARGRQEARVMSPYHRLRRLARRATSAPPIPFRTRAHLEGVRTPMTTCSSAKHEVEHGSLHLLSVVERGSPEMSAVERGSRGEVEHGSPHSLPVEHGSRFLVVERGSPNAFSGFRAHCPWTHTRRYAVHRERRKRRYCLPLPAGGQIDRTRCLFGAHYLERRARDGGRVHTPDGATAFRFFNR